MPKVIDLPTATTMDDGDYLLMEESTGGTKKITKSNALKNSYLSAGNSGSVSIPARTRTDVCSLTLTPGVWVITGQVTSDGGSTTGMASLCITTQSGTNQYTVGGYFAQNIEAGWKSITTSRIINVTASSQVVYLTFYHENGSNRNIPGTNNANMQAVRVG